VVDARAGQKSSRGESSKTEVTEFAAIPIGARGAREQVDDGVRTVERLTQRRLVEHVCPDGSRPEALELRAAARGARDARDAMAGSDEFADGAPSDDARGSGDDDFIHIYLTR